MCTFRYSSDQKKSRTLSNYWPINIDQEFTASSEKTQNEKYGKTRIRVNVDVTDVSLAKYMLERIYAVSLVSFDNFFFGTRNENNEFFMLAFLCIFRLVASGHFKIRLSQSGRVTSLNNAEVLLCRDRHMMHEIYSMQRMTNNVRRSQESLKLGAHGEH